MLPHLKVPELAEALHTTRARRLVTLNLAPQAGRPTTSPQQHLEVLWQHAPDLAIDVVLADTGVVDDPDGLEKTAVGLGGSSWPTSRSRTALRGTTHVVLPRS
nr:hypothetical protein GCM10020093_029730 [Planobispora longispora]